MPSFPLISLPFLGLYIHWLDRRHQTAGALPPIPQFLSCKRLGRKNAGAARCRFSLQNGSLNAKECKRGGRLRRNVEEHRGMHSGMHSSVFSGISAKPFASCKGAASLHFPKRQGEDEASQAAGICSTDINHIVCPCALLFFFFFFPLDSTLASTSSSPTSSSPAPATPFSKKSASPPSPLPSLSS